MRKFTVRPTAFQSRPAKVGSPQGDYTEWVWLGRLGESGALTSMHFDVGSEHVVAIFGKRGSGKSYALGTLLEGLCVKDHQSPVANISGKRAVLLFDTLGVFQWMDQSLPENPRSEELKRQLVLRRGWDIKCEPLDVQVYVPFGSRTATTPAHHQDFAVVPADLSASDLGYLLGLDIIQDRMGQLINDAYMKVTAEGWEDETRRQHPARLSYRIVDLIQCVTSDRELTSVYAPETRRAVLQQLMTIERNPVFQDQGTSLGQLLKPGQLSVVVLSKMPDELRLVLVTTLIRKILGARVEASENEKHLKVREDLSDEERAVLQQATASAIPPCWIAVDEAQNVLPSERRTTATEVLVKLVREGRNFGISFVVTTQQPTAIDQRILAQVDTIVAHRLTVQTDIEYVRKNLKSNMPTEVRYGNATLAFDELLRALDIGQALVSNTDTERSFIMDIRPRLSVHGGF